MDIAALQQKGLGFSMAWHLVEGECQTTYRGAGLRVKNWFVYLVRAQNGALYCGISDDPERRFAQHQKGTGARFFYSSPAQALVYLEVCVDKRAALRRECAIKKLRKTQKELLVLTHHS